MEQSESIDFMALLQGPALIPILSSHECLRNTIVSLEQCLEYLKENERRIFPDLAPEPGRRRRNEKREPLALTSANKEKRLLRLIGKLTANRRKAPTMRELGQYTKGTHLSDGLAELVKGMVGAGALREVKSYGTIRYSIPSAGEEAKPKVLAPVGHLHLAGHVVDVYHVTYHYASDGKPGYVVNGDNHLVFHFDTKEYDVIDNWLNVNDRAYCTLRLDEPLPS